MPTARFCIVLGAAMFATLPLAHAMPMPPNAPDQIVHEWTFDDGDTGGWAETHDIEALKVIGGVLRGTSDGPDAFMAVRGLGYETSEITHIRVRMRSTAAGATQVYFATSTHANPAANGVPHFSCPAGDAFADYEVRLEGMDGWEGRLDYLRIDPVNGQSEDAVFDIDSITLLRRAPRPALVDFFADAPLRAPGETVTLRLVIENVGGGVLPMVSETGGMQAILSPGGFGDKVKRFDHWESLDPNSDRAQYAAEWVVEEVNETTCYTAEVVYGGNTLLAAQSMVVVADVASLPGPSGGPLVGVRADGTGVIEDAQVSLHIHGAKKGTPWGLLRARSAKDGPWQIMGLAAPLVTLGRRTPLDGDRIEIPAMTVSAGSNALWLTNKDNSRPGELRVRLSRGNAPGTIQFATTLTAQDQTELLRLGSPRYLVGEGSLGESKQAALFPGIEFLGPDDRSSDVSSTGTSLGFRHTPPPYQITVPIMAVSAGNMTTGMLWNALQTWTGQEQLPMATFASPNFLHGQRNHLMETFIPNYPVWTERNGMLARQPLTLAVGETVHLEGAFFASSDTGVTDVVPLWYEVHGQPEPVTPAKPLDDTFDTLMQGWVNTFYDPIKDAYTNHWRHGMQPGPANWLKARMVAHACLTGDWSLARKMGIERGATPREYLGSLFATIPPARPDAPMASQRADGSWGYDCPESVAERSREFTNGDRDTLGREGDTNVGLCATQALPILRYAAVTGDAEAEAAGLRALAAMSDFIVPAGSQTWEVHMDAPDIFAACQALDCHALAYQLTKNDAIRRHARYWAYAALPFLYAYEVPGGGPDGKVTIPGDPLTEGSDYMEGTHPFAAVFENPDRKVTPYGSIPVFGTSFYVVNWFGTLVQWCGLRWAESVLNAEAVVGDPVLLKAARGVVVSGCEQTFDKAPVEGCLPDAWHINTNSAWPAFIGPVVLEGPLRTILDKPSYCDAHTDVVHGGGLRAHLTTRGQTKDRALEPGVLRWTERYLVASGQEAFIAGLPKPEAVVVDGVTLPRGNVTGSTQAAWDYEEATGYLRIRAKAEASDGAPTAEAAMEVRFPAE